MVRPAFALMACSTIALVAVARGRPTGVLSPAADLEGIDEALDNLVDAVESQEREEEEHKTSWLGAMSTWAGTHFTDAYVYVRTPYYNGEDPGKGWLRGTWTDTREVTTFWFVPYARTQTSANRWKAPLSLPKTTKTALETTLPKPAAALGSSSAARKVFEKARDCVSPPSMLDVGVGTGGIGSSTSKGTVRKCFQHLPGVSAAAGHIGSEDCLYLHVMVPGAPLLVNHKTVGKSEFMLDTSKRKKVMVWFHGGAYLLGDPYQNSMTDAHKLADDEDVIVVGVQYRVGPLGFLAHPDLKRNDGGYGNYGMLDQTEALRWVQDNIEAFGGDPGKVTIFGESAGGMSVCYHVGMAAHSPQKYSKLFQAAVMQSGNCESPFTGFGTMRLALENGEKYVSAIKAKEDEVYADCKKAAEKKCQKGLTTGIWTDSGRKQCMNKKLATCKPCAGGAAACALSLPTDKVWLNKLGTVEEIIPTKSLTKVLSHHATRSKSGLQGLLDKAFGASKETRGEDLSNLYEALPLALPWQPVIDGVATSLPDMPLSLIQKGDLKGKNIVIGFNENEGTMFITGVMMAYMKGVDPLLPSDANAKDTFKKVIEELGPKNADPQTTTRIAAQLIDTYKAELGGSKAVEGKCEEEDLAKKCVTVASRVSKVTSHLSQMWSGSNAHDEQQAKCLATKKDECIERETSFQIYEATCEGIRDLSFACPAFTVADAIKEAGGTAYVYRFAYNPGGLWVNTDGVGDDKVGGMGVHHMFDLFFTFQLGDLPVVGKYFSSKKYGGDTMDVARVMGHVVATAIDAGSKQEEAPDGENNREKVKEATKDASVAGRTLLLNTPLFPAWGVGDTYKVAKITGATTGFGGAGGHGTTLIELIEAKPTAATTMPDDPVSGNMREQGQCKAWADAIDAPSSFAPHSGGMRQ